MHARALGLLAFALPAISVADTSLPAPVRRAPDEATTRAGAGDAKGNAARRQLADLGLVTPLRGLDQVRDMARAAPALSGMELIGARPESPAWEGVPLAGARATGGAESLGRLGTLVATGGCQHHCMSGGVCGRCRPPDPPRRPPAVTGDEALVTVGAPLARRTVQRAVAARRAILRHCYERELLRQPGLGGTVVARFLVRPDGQVVDVDTDEGTLDSDAVRRCVAESLTAHCFPTGSAPVRVRYPFAFAPAAVE